MSQALKKETESTEAGPSKQAALMYRDRLISLKKGRICMGKNDIPRAVKYYREYLAAIAIYKKVEIDNLNPELFKNEHAGVSEMLLLSHVYWDLSRAYDMSPSFQRDLRKTLDKFVAFSSGTKFQNINALMLKRYLKKRLARNREVFQEAFDKIYVKPKACFVATFCLGESHPELASYYHFRDKYLINNKFGRSMVKSYYFFSPLLVHFLNRPTPVSRVLSKIFKNTFLAFHRLFVSK